MRWTSWRKPLRSACSVFLLAAGTQAVCQQPLVQRWRLDLPVDHKQLLERTEKATFSAFAIVPEAQSYPASISIEINGQKYTVPLDHHAPRPTYFLSVDTPVAALQIDFEGLIDFYAINSGQPPPVERRNSQISSDCLTMPATVDQEDWRAGLPAPNFSRIPNEVTHHIVHHTAGSNTNTNYTQVVRDIYLYHTEVNGWSDIGYNFLVAQDGTIYDGRDPGNDLTEFEVVGAHFCGKNTGTLGVSMLGDFETATPEEPALNSLQELLAFSFDMLDLDPEASSSHRGEILDNLSGHRDGCSTLCPGANLYGQLATMQTTIKDNIENCEAPTPPDPVTELSFQGLNSANTRTLVEFVNTSAGYDSYQWIFEGGSPSTDTARSVQVTYQRAGHYDVQLIGYMAAQAPDTLSVRDYIVITSNQGIPLIYPNPVEAGSALDVELDDPIVSIQIVSVTGREVAYYLGVDSQILIPATLYGYYVLRIRTQREIFWAKLRVQ